VETEDDCQRRARADLFKPNSGKTRSISKSSRERCKAREKMTRRDGHATNWEHGFAAQRSAPIHSQDQRSSVRVQRAGTHSPRDSLDRRGVQHDRSSPGKASPRSKQSNVSAFTVRWIGGHGAFVLWV
jgi:hypothetical protein